MVRLSVASRGVIIPINNLIRNWSVVVPIRDPRKGKSRLESGTTINAALAYDTLSAALGCAEIRDLLLVTDDPWWVGRDLLDESRFTLLVHRELGLNSAIIAGLRQIDTGVAGARHLGGGTAVLLGDLPCLQPEDLAAALRAARTVSRGMVSDHHRTGTTLLTGTSHLPHFGPGSAARHRDAGYQELPLPRGSTLRHDVDTPQDLTDATHRLGVGPRTRRALRLDPAAAGPVTHDPATTRVPTAEAFA